MVDAAALYGLAGAVGGALLGAVAAVRVASIQNRVPERARQEARAEAEIGRLVELRSATREVLFLQERAVRQLLADETVDVDAFTVSTVAALNVARRAADLARVDGFNLHLSPSSVNSYEELHRTSRRRPPAWEGQEDVMRIMIELGELATDLRSAMQSRARGTMAPGTPEELADRFAHVERLRGALISLLLDRVEDARGRLS